MIGDLLPQHQKLIEESAISPEVAAARGYRSVPTKAELLGLGFSKTQARTPALLLPLWSVHGEKVNYQIRPDEPRIFGGKPIKYETPRGSRMDLDVPPPCRDGRGDPALPLYITEAIRKADAAASMGLCCVALLGVWNWRGTNDQGGKVALAAFESIALDGRDVYLVFDSDAWTNRNVAMALRRLRDFLKGRGAHVRVIRLPVGPGGVKTGLDDYFASGASVDDLMSLVTDNTPSMEADDDNEASYRSSPDGLVRLRRAGDDLVEERLTNFVARISGDIIEDDGVEQQRLFEVEATLHGRSVTFRVAARSFTSMSWPAEHLGAGAVVFPRVGDHARTAIQILSGTPPERRVYASTGWHDIDGEQAYLHAGGALGPDGPVPGVEVHLEEPLTAFLLPDPPEEDDVREAIRASLGMLEVASDPVAFPLLAATFRPPLGDFDLSVHLTGPTGVFKTELAALAQMHYGVALDARHLPGAWSSTANANEDLLFRAKDALLVIDDFAPGGSAHDIGRANREADRVMRAAGNRSARQRMRADGSLRPPRPPRGLLLSTGEDVPRGASLVARMVEVEVAPGDVRADELTRCQEDARAGRYVATMAGYVRWLAPMGASGRRSLLSPLSAATFESAGPGPRHRRTPRNLVSLATGLHAFLKYAEQAGAIDTVEHFRLWERGESALLAVAGMQTASQASEDPVTRFVEYFRSALGSGRAHVAAQDGTVPTDPEAWGWRQDDAHGDHGGWWRAHGSRVGWVEDDDLYLDPSAAYAVVQAVAREVGDTISLQPRTLHKRMHEAGLLISTEPDRQRLTVRKTLEGSRRAVLHLSAHFPEAAQPAHSAQTEDDHVHDGPVAWDGSAGDEGTNGPDIDPETAQPEEGVFTNGSAGPVGPDHNHANGIVAEMQRLLDTGALAGHAPVRLGPGVDIADVEKAVRVSLAEAHRNGHIGDVARDRLAAILAVVAGA